jgi:hypothetical protein
MIRNTARRYLDERYDVVEPHHFISSFFCYTHNDHSYEISFEPVPFLPCVPRSTPAAPFCIRGTRARSTETRFRRNTASSFYRLISRSEGSRTKSVGSGYAGEVWSVYKPPARHSTSCCSPPLASRLLPSRLSSNSLHLHSHPLTLPTKQKTTTPSKCLPPLGPSEFRVASAGGVSDRGSSSYRHTCLSAPPSCFLLCSPCAAMPLVSRITTTLNTGAKMPIFGLGTWQSAVGHLSTSSLLFAFQRYNVLMNCSVLRSLAQRGQDCRQGCSPGRLQAH